MIFLLCFNIQVADRIKRGGGKQIPVINVMSLTFIYVFMRVIKYFMYLPMNYHIINSPSVICFIFNRRTFVSVDLK